MCSNDSDRISTSKRGICSHVYTQTLLTRFRTWSNSDTYFFVVRKCLLIAHFFGVADFSAIIWIYRMNACQVDAVLGEMADSIAMINVFYLKIKPNQKLYECLMFIEFTCICNWVCYWGFKTHVFNGEITSLKKKIKLLL